MSKAHTEFKSHLCSLHMMLPPVLHIHKSAQFSVSHESPTYTQMKRSLCHLQMHSVQHSHRLGLPIKYSNSNCRPVSRSRPLTGHCFLAHGNQSIRAFSLRLHKPNNCLQVSPITGLCANILPQQQYLNIYKK